MLILDISQKPHLAIVKWRFQRKATNQNSCGRCCRSDSVAISVVTKNWFAAASLAPCIAVFAVLASFCAHAAGIELRAQLREHLKNPEFSLDRKPEYVVTNPAFIEPVLDQALKYIDAHEPLSAATLAKAKANAVTYYRLGMNQPAGLKALQARIAARFAASVVTRKSIAASPGNPATAVVDVNLGWMIGTLVPNTRYGFAYAATGDDFEGRAPSTRLLARLLVDAARTYPKAERVSVTLTLPRSRMGTTMRATFIRAGFPQSRHGWVTLESLTAPTSRPLYQVRVHGEDFSPYQDGRYSFYVDCAATPSVSRVPQFTTRTVPQGQACW